MLYLENVEIKSVFHKIKRKTYKVGDHVVPYGIIERFELERQIEKVTVIVVFKTNTQEKLENL